MLLILKVRFKNEDNEDSEIWFNINPMTYTVLNTNILTSLFRPVNNTYTVERFECKFILFISFRN